MGPETSHFHSLLGEICSPPFLVAALLLLSLVLVTPEAARPRWPRPPLSVLQPGRCRHLPGAPGASEEELSWPGYSSASGPKGSLVVHPVPCCLDHVMAALAAVRQTTWLWPTRSEGRNRGSPTLETPKMLPRGCHSKHLAQGLWVQEGNKVVLSWGTKAKCFPVSVLCIWGWGQGWRMDT